MEFTNLLYKWTNVGNSDWGYRGQFRIQPSCIVAKQEIILEETEGAEHSQNSGEGFLYWHGVKEGTMQIFSFFCFDQIVTIFLITLIGFLEKPCIQIQILLFLWVHYTD